MKNKRFIAMAGVVAAMLLAIPAIAMARDSNNDRIPDRWEKSNHLSLNVNQAKRDQDRDGLKNRGEFMRGTDPRDDDSDNDGTEDGAECVGAQSENVDSDDDGVNDDAELECDNDGQGDDDGGLDDSDDGGQQGSTD